MSGVTVGTMVGPYVVSKLIKEGQGGMSQVCIATLAEGADHGNSSVALKVSKVPEQGSAEDHEDVQELYHDALANEVEILKGLKHPNIVRIFPIRSPLRNPPYIARATNVPGRPWFFVMEYIASDSLAHILDRAMGSRLPLKMAVEIVYQVGLALEYIHLKEIAHLDIKPDNILFWRPPSSDTKPELALIDFGIARRDKQTGLKAGAATYMAPERIMLVRGELTGSVGDQRPADVYSLGVILYRCIAGKSPLGRRDKSTTTAVILKEEPLPLSQHVQGVPPVMEDIITRCLSKEPQNRPTISEFLAALDESVPPPRWSVLPKTEEVKPSRTRSPLAVGVAIGVTLFAVIALVLAFSIAQPPVAPKPVSSPAALMTSAPVVIPSITATAVPTVAQPTVTPISTYTPGPPTNTPEPSATP